MAPIPQRIFLSFSLLTALHTTTVRNPPITAFARRPRNAQAGACILPVCASKPKRPELRPTIAATGFLFAVVAQAERRAFNPRHIDDTRERACFRPMSTGEGNFPWCRYKSCLRLSYAAIAQYGARSRKRRGRFDSERRPLYGSSSTGRAAVSKTAG